MEKDKDRLSILERVEKGEISIEEAEAELEQVPEEDEAVVAQVEGLGTGSEVRRDSQSTNFDTPSAIQPEGTEQVTEKKPEETYASPDDLAAHSQALKKHDVGSPTARKKKESEEAYVSTRRERKLALAERFQNWQPQMMVGLMDGSDASWQWPWPDKNWQWMWQNFGYPVYMSHSIDATEGSELQVVSYQGDLFIRGWDEPMLKVNGAVFDVRIGQDENVIRVASSTGQLQIWVPGGIARVKARVEPGDMWLSSICADVDMNCQSGDLGCERIKGNVKARVNGGDVRLMGIEGSIDANVIRGNSEVRGISSENVSLKAMEGNIWLSLNSVSSGIFRCENDKGDINLLSNGELSCELLVEATRGGRISPVILPWQRLLERSESKLHGILRNGGASISLVTESGRIYIQESWMNTFPVPSSG